MYFKINIVLFLVIDPEANDLKYEDVETRAFGYGPIRHCPKCDSSVFGYCSDKLFHDSCCCSNPYG